MDTYLIQRYVVTANEHLDVRHSYLLSKRNDDIVPLVHAALVLQLNGVVADWAVDFVRGQRC